MPKLERLAYQMGHNAGVAHHKLATQDMRETLTKSLALNKSLANTLRKANFWSQDDYLEAARLLTLAGELE